MTLRYFRNGPARQLSFAVASSADTSITVDSASGFPTQVPFTIIIDPDGALEEACDVTAVVGNVLTVTRGVDSTTASAHAAGVTVIHGVIARDFREANTHVNATENIHGTTGALVDEDSAQTVTGAKLFTGGLSTAAGPVVTDGGDQVIDGLKTFATRPTTSSNGDVLTTGGGQSVAGTTTLANTVQTGTESHAGAETHTGAETHSGTVRLSHANMQAVSVVSSVDEPNYTGTAFTAGASPVGLVFTAPPSAKGFMTLSGYFNQVIDGQVSIMSYVIREGAVIGSGASVITASADRALTAGRAVNAGSPPQPQASRRSLITGLTAGTVYNAQVEYQTTAGGNISVFVRELLWEPHL